MKLIDKDVIVAEIERQLKETDKGFPNDHNIGRYDACKRMISFINSLEVKEVDLEKELESWRHKHFHGRRDDKGAAGEWLERTSQLDIAKHFFELGLNASNPLTWEDIACINAITDTLLCECGDKILYTEENFSKEVLKRFKAQKGE